MWTAIGTIAAIILTVLAWIKQASDVRAKQKADEDAKIDACNDADSVLRELDRLRRKDASGGN